MFKFKQNLLPGIFQFILKSDGDELEMLRTAVWLFNKKPWLDNILIQILKK